jgi:hypothetical protein
MRRLANFGRRSRNRQRNERATLPHRVQWPTTAAMPLAERRPGMTPVLVGYFPKRTQVPEGWHAAAGVSEMCSVSTCLAPAPEGWIDHWRHNDLGFFDSPEIAQGIIPAGATGFSIFAYRLFPQRYEDGLASPFAITPVSPRPLGSTFRSLGFDVVSKSASHYFECSPLSCNSLAGEVPVNRYCLIESLDVAVGLAIRASVGDAEPGPYYILEVFRDQVVD